MSMSTHVVAFKPPDEKWKQMKAAFDACRAAGVEPPKEVWDYFLGCEPSDEGVEVSEKRLLHCGAVLKWSDGRGSSGFQVDVKKLPPDVTVVRFYNSW